ncbi:MAG TPA: hypothetical protein DER33_10015 [Syntrophomonas sp.]|jgi:transcriptional regulator with XRE-family HTH domain|nr:hypothetical protein [Syntrophomonas sp.]
MFKDQLRKLRKIKGLSQYTLAEQVGLSRGQIANYEQGTREPDYETLKSLAKYFGVTTNELLYAPDELEEIETYRRANESTLDNINKHNEAILQKTSTKNSNLTHFLHTKIAENAIAEINQMLNDNPELLPYIKELLVSAQNLTPSQVEMLNGFIRSMTDTSVVNDVPLVAESPNKYDPLAASGNPKPMDDLPPESLKQIEGLKRLRLKRFKKD